MLNVPISKSELDGGKIIGVPGIRKNVTEVEVTNVENFPARSPFTKAPVTPLIPAKLSSDPSIPLISLVPAETRNEYSKVSPTSESSTHWRELAGIKVPEQARRTVTLTKFMGRESTKANCLRR